MNYGRILLVRKTIEDLKKLEYNIGKLIIPFRDYNDVPRYIKICLRAHELTEKSYST